MSARHGTLMAGSLALALAVIGLGADGAAAET